MAGRRKDAEGRGRDSVAAWFREGEDELPPVESGKRAYLGLGSCAAVSRKVGSS